MFLSNHENYKTHALLLRTGVSLVYRQITEQTSIKYVLLLTKTTAAQNKVALSYHRVRGLYFLEVVLAVNIVLSSYMFLMSSIIKC